MWRWRKTGVMQPQAGNTWSQQKPEERARGPQGPFWEHCLADSWASDLWPQNYERISLLLPAAHLVAMCVTATRCEYRVPLSRSRPPGPHLHDGSGCPSC